LGPHFKRPETCEVPAGLFAIPVAGILAVPPTFRSGNRRLSFTRANHDPASRSRMRFIASRGARPLLDHGVQFSLALGADAASEEIVTRKSQHLHAYLDLLARRAGQRLLVDVERGAESLFLQRGAFRRQ
jgi:hypothetical protein